MTPQSRRSIGYAAALAVAAAAIAVFFAHGAERADLPLLLLGALAGGAFVWAASVGRRARLAMAEAVCENVTDYISIADAEGRVLRQSPSVARQLGHAAEERVGLSALDLVHPEDLPEARRALEIVLAKPGGAWSFRHRVRHRDGSWRVLDSHLKNLLDAPAVRGIVVSSRDVTDGVRAEVRQATQLAVTRVLNEAAGIAEASPSILEAICRCAGWDLGEAWCADGSGDVLRWKGSWHLPGVNGAAFDAVSRETTFARGQGLPGRVWECGTPAWLMDVAQDPEFVRRTAAKSEGLHAALAFPVGKGAGSGVLVFFSHELKEPDLGLLDVMAEVGMKIGQFVESKRTEQALRDSEERFHRLSECTTEGVAIHDADVIVDVNQAMTRITGYARQELVGRSGFDLVLPESREFLARRLAQGIVGRVEILAQRKDGTSFPAEIDSRTIGYRDGAARVWAVRDITDRKQAEAALRESEARYLRVLYAVGAALASPSDVGQACRSIVREVATTLGYGAAAILLVDREREELHEIAYHGHGLQRPNARLRLGEGLSSRVVATARVQVTPDVTLEPAYVPGVPGCHSEVDVPITLRGEVVGVLVVEDVRVDAYTPEDISLLTAVAAQAAIAIDNARLYAQLTARRIEEQAGLLRLSQALLAETDVQALLTLAAHSAAETLGAEFAAVALLDADAQQIAGGAGVGWPTDVLEQFRSKSGPLAPALLQAVRTRMPVLVPDAAREAGSEIPDWLKRLGLGSALIVPMLVGERAIGGIVVNHRTAHAWDDDELRLLSLIANSATQAIERARLFEAEHAMRERAETLREAARIVGSSLELDEVLRLILDQLKRVLVYDTASVLLLGEAGSPDLVVGIGYADEERTSGASHGLLGKSPILRQMAGDLRPAIVADVREHPGWIWVPGAEHVRSFLAVPIVTQGQMTGALMVDRTRTGFFKETDARVAQALAQHMAVAIENARLFEAVRQSEARHRSLVESARDAIYTLSPDGTVTSLNPAFETMTGWSRAEWLGQSFAQLIHPDDGALALETFERLLQGEAPPVFELRIRSKRGEYVLSEFTGTPQFQDGSVAGVLGIARDITERKLADAAMGKLSRATEQTADSVVITDTAGVIEYVNPAFEQMTGYARSEAAGRTMALLSSGRHDEAFYRRLWTTILGGEAFRAEFVNRKKNGELYHQEETISPVKDARGQITHFVATGSDITERKRAEVREDAHFAVTRILAEAPGLRQAVPAILEAICRGMGWDLGELWLVDAEARHLTWYDSWHPPDHDMSGFESASHNLRFVRGEGLPGRVWGKGAPAWVPDVIEDLGFLRKPSARRAGLHGAVGFPIRGSSALNGVMVFLSGRAREPEEAVLRTMEDIGRQVGQFIERKRAEEEEERLQRAVQRSALEWRLTFDAIDSPILMVDAEGRVVRLNRAAQDNAGKSFEQILGRPLEAIQPGQPWCTAAALAREVAEARAAQTIHVKDDATGRTWDLAAALATAGDGDERIVIVASDVTRIVELQESLRRSETMSVMGSLVAGVAHEVRNPLFSISANIDAFEARFGDREEYRETLQVLRSEVDRLGGLMQALLDYGKPPALEMAERSLEDVVAQAVHACRPQATRGRASLVNELRGGLPTVLMDRKRLVQVFQNLIQNAVQHTPPRGTVRISARAGREGTQDSVHVLVEDSGPGFAEEDLPRIFEPFFTRRPGGTGLGLSVAARIVEEHGGRITARNRAEGGAAMAVWLPCVGGSPHSAKGDHRGT